MASRFVAETPCRSRCAPGRRTRSAPCRQVFAAAHAPSSPPFSGRRRTTRTAIICISTWPSGAAAIASASERSGGRWGLAIRRRAAEKNSGPSGQGAGSMEGQQVNLDCGLAVPLQSLASRLRTGAFLRTGGWCALAFRQERESGPPRLDHLPRASGTVPAPERPGTEPRFASCMSRMFSLSVVHHRKGEQQGTREHLHSCAA